LGNGGKRKNMQFVESLKLQAGLFLYKV
jgi:hypothetical protein